MAAQADPASSSATSRNAASPISWTPKAVIADMERIVAQEPGQDAVALERLESGLQGHLQALAMMPNLAAGRLIDIAADKKKDWRLRRFAATGLSMSYSKKIIEPLVAILLDKGERPEVRGGAALGLMSVAEKSEEAGRALLEVVRDTETPRSLVDDAMVGVQSSAVKDIDLMLKIVDMPARSLNSMGTNFSAIRAIGGSKDPRSMEVMIKLLEKFPPNTLKRGVVFDVLLVIAKRDKEKFNAWAPKLFEPLLKATFEEKFGHGALNVVVQILGEFRDPRAVDRLIELMNDPKQAIVIVWRAANALGRIGDRRALPHVQRLWDGIPNDPRSDYRLRKEFNRWKNEGPSGSIIIPEIKNILEKLKKVQN